MPVSAKVIKQPAWSITETKVWANLTDAGQSNLRPEDNISAAFLVQILTHDRFSSKLKNKGVTIVGGHLAGDLLLNHVKIDIPIVYLSMSFDARVDVSDSQFTGTLSFRGATLRQGMEASRAAISGSLQLGDSDDTKYIGSRRPGGSHIGSISAPHLRLDGDFVLSGATVQNTINLSNSYIKGSATLMYLDTGSIDISASQIDNQLIFYNSAIHHNTKGHEENSDDINLYSLRTKQTVYINRTTVENDVTIEGAEIEGDLVLLGAKLAMLNARGAKVSGSLIVGLNDATPQTWTEWWASSTLDLTSSHFGGLRGPERLEMWPKRIFFHNFTMGLYSVEFCGAEVCVHSRTWYEKWLGLQADNRPAYEPYKQISDMLVSEGQTSEAAEVSVAGHDVERDDALAHHEFIRYALLLIYGWSVGYGNHLEYSLYLILAMICIGALIFRNSEEARTNNMPFGIAYSFDMLLPIVRLREEHYKIDLHGPERYYFYFHKLMGWALGLLLAAVMAGITTK